MKVNCRIWEYVDIEGYNLEVVKDFVYLASSINTDNDISLEIRRRITLANRCYFGLRKQLKSHSWRTQICFYKSLILQVLLYGAETGTLTSSEEQALGVCEIKILRKIHEPFCDIAEWHIRWNRKLYDIYDDIDVVKRIKIQPFRWLSLVWIAPTLFVKSSNLNQVGQTG